MGVGVASWVLLVGRIVVWCCWQDCNVVGVVEVDWLGVGGRIVMWWEM